MNGMKKVAVCSVNFSSEREQEEGRSQAKNEWRYKSEWRSEERKTVGEEERPFGR